MGRKIHFKAELKRIIDETSTVASKRAIEKSPIQIVIRVSNEELGYFYDWNPDVFDQRF